MSGTLRSHKEKKGIIANKNQTKEFCNLERGIQLLQDTALLGKEIP